MSLSANLSLSGAELSFYNLCPNSQGGCRGGASGPPCTTYASGQPLLYKASRLFTAFVLKVQKLGGVCSCPELGPWGGWGRGSYAHNGLLHLPLRSGKSLIIAILWFVFVFIVTASVSLVSCLIFQSILQCSLHFISQPPHIRYYNWTETTLRTPRVQSVKCLL